MFHRLRRKKDGVRTATRPQEEIRGFDSMAFVSLKAWRARSAEQAQLAKRVKADCTVALGLGEGDAITVNEIACTDPGCPDIETVVLVMRAGEPTRAIRIRSPMEVVGAAELLQLAADERALREAAP